MYYKKNLISMNYFVIITVILMSTFKLAKFQCIEPECEQNSRVAEESHTNKQNDQNQDIVLPFLDLKTPIDVKLARDLSQIPFDSIINWKISPEFKSISSINPKSSAFLPIIGRIAKNSKPVRSQDYSESKRNGNRNFQTQGW